MITPATSLSHITGIGPKLAEKLALAGLFTVSDLAFYFPRLWEDLSNLTPIAHLLADGQKHTIRATLTELKAFRSPRKRMHLTQAVFTDETGSVNGIWFNQPYLAKSLSLESNYFITGQVTQNQDGLSFSAPTIEPADTEGTPVHSGRIIPTYPETYGLSTKVIRKLMLQIRSILSEVEDPLPSAIREKYQLESLGGSLTSIHFPENLEALQTAKDRLGFDELLTTQLAVGQMKRYLKSKTADPIPLDIELVKEILTYLPFQLTAAQKRALWEILQDLAKPEPTNRMLEGDVGSGKTIVVAIAMILTAKASFSACLMAPTEVLAMQHYRKLLPLFEKVGVPLRLSTRIYNEGPEDALVVIGTHTLIQSTADFANLNLVIVDEQHRFGVKQREALKQKGKSPHFISLTATPIPRSLALTIFGDLDLSIIGTKPLGRQPITTQLVTDENRDRVYELIRQEIDNGHQAFVVAPVISADNKLSLKSAEATFSQIQADFPKARVGLLHGRLKGNEKTETLQSFADGKLDILVATTVIEVGIDVPKATVMLIEQADRFGLAQLHQLRGRVGRSSDKSYCFISPETNDPAVIERLTLFANTLDGFKLAELDLQLRGPGSLFGSMQSGFLHYRLANWTDANAIKRSRDAANDLLDLSSDLSQFPDLAKKVDSINLVSHNE